MSLHDNILTECETAVNFSFFEIALITTVIYGMTRIMPKFVTWFILSRRERKSTPAVKNNHNNNNR